jgi:hypothetical protein
LPSQIGEVQSVETINEFNGESAETMKNVKQSVKIKLVSGEHKGEKVFTENTLMGNPAYDIKLKAKDKVILHVEEENRPMRIKEEYKVREMAGEHIVVMQGRYGVDMTKVIALNETSLWLWNRLQGREFGTDDVRDLLLGEYDVDAETAERDAQAWVARLKTCNLVEE